MNVKLLLNQQVRDHLQRGLLVLMLLLFFAFEAQAQTVTSYKDDYAPGEIAIISGTGWSSDSYVDVHFEETPAYHEEHQHDYHGIAVDANGNWEIKYQIEERHFGVAFDVHVVGKQSGYEAHTHFTDAVSLTSISPNSGTTGTEVTISGDGLFVNNWNTRIKFGSIEATEKAGTRKTSKPQSVVVYAPAQILPTGEYKVTAEVYRNNPGNGILQIETSPQDFFFRYGKLSQTITFTEVADKTFGGAAFAIDPSASSGLAVAVTTTGGISYDAATGMVNVTAAGPASITAIQAGNTIYDAATSVTRSFTIGKAATTTVVTLAAGPFTYTGSAITPATVSVTGAGGLDLTPAAAYANNVDAGTATASYSYAGDDNYLASEDSKTFTIGKADATLALGNLTHTFDGTLKSATATTTPAGLTGVTVSGSGTNFGDYDAAASLDNANYTATAVNGTLSISKAPSAVSMDNVTATYNGYAHAASATVTGDGGLNTTESITYSYVGTGSTTYTASAAAPINAGTYNVTATYAGGANHTGSSKTATVTINKAAATISVTDLAKTYNGSAQGATVTTSPAGLAVTVTFDGAAAVPTAAGSYDVVAALNNSNYSAENATGTLVIAPKALTVTANNKEREYNVTNPTLDGIIEGTIAADNIIATYSTEATQTSNVGEYPVTATLAANSKLVNYTVTNIPGTLKITPASATIALSNLKYMFDGAAKSATVTTSPEGLAVTVTYAGSTNLPTAAGAYAIVAALNNSNYAAANTTATLNIYNAPVVTLNVSEPIQVNGSSVVTATQEGDVFSNLWRIASPNGFVATYPITGSSYTITSSIVGVYTITMTYENGVGDAGTSEKVFSVFYDPAAGFVTGGGWINSPEGASPAYPDAVGKANFGFVSKYEKGATKPTGNTEFQFKAGDLNFKSSNYQWLTVAGARAQYKGTGTINGLGSYDFILTAIDGQVSGGNNIDRFRIKITSGAVTIYDNQGGVDEADLDPLRTQVTGSIVIHQPAVKATNIKSVVATGTVVPEALVNTKFSNYPNPYNDRTTITFSTEKEESFALEVYDVKGTLVKKVDIGVTEAGKTYEYDFESRSLPVGVYFARLITASEVQTIKMVLKR